VPVGELPDALTVTGAVAYAVAEPLETPLTPLIAGSAYGVPLGVEDVCGNVPPPPPPPPPPQATRVEQSNAKTASAR